MSSERSGIMAQMFANPFTPVFGKMPPFMAGREQLLEDVEQALSSQAADPNLCTVFIGARGTGKTAMLTYLSREASARGWVAANVSAVPGMLEDVVERSLKAAESFVDVPGGARLKSVALGQLLGIEWEYRSPSSGNWRTRMTDLIEKLNEQDVGLLITVDEVKPSVDDMIQLVSVYQHFVREERKVALFMAGLPSQVSTLVSNESVSFLRRAKTRRLGRIANAEIGVTLRKTIETFGKKIDSKALERAVDSIDGFPYMMQLVGFRLWEESGEDECISTAHAEVAVRGAESDFRESVLEATYRELSDGDLDFLEAMLADGHVSAISDIASRLGRSASHARVYKGRLIEQGIIAEERRGHVAFDLPHFREFLEEKLAC